MKLTCEKAMMLGNIISSAGQSHYEGKKRVSEMIGDEIKETWDRMRTVMARDDYNTTTEEWMVTQLKKCAEMRRLKSFFEEAEG